MSSNNRLDSADLPTGMIVHQHGVDSTADQEEIPPKSRLNRRHIIVLAIAIAVLVALANGVSLSGVFPFFSAAARLRNAAAVDGAQAPFDEEETGTPFTNLPGCAARP